MRLKPLRLAVEYGIMHIDAKTKQCLKRALSDATQRRDGLVQEVSDLERDIIALRRLLRNSSESTDGRSQRHLENGTTVGRIRSALKSFGGTASVLEVTERLKSEGLSLDGKTPMRTYVGGALSRMAGKKASPVKRVRKGRYKYQE